MGRGLRKMLSVSRWLVTGIFMLLLIALNLFWFIPQEDGTDLSNTFQDEKKHLNENDAAYRSEQKKCEITEDQSTKYPHCLGKMNWMTTKWKADPCYVQFGVDGSLCSIRIYLSEVEDWCPRLESRIDFLKTTPTLQMVKPNYAIEGLINLLQEPNKKRQNYAIMKERINNMWDGWIQSAKSIISKNIWKPHSKKRILIHFGFLTAKSKFTIIEMASKGGPRGELVQWSDIISSLYVLGHDLIFTCEDDQLRAILAKFPNYKAQCQAKRLLPVDIIMTDIIGLHHFQQAVGAGFGKFRCLLRIIDSFGTEPAYNDATWAKTHKLKSPWGGRNLNPQQFYTMFPHSPDNSFMGFVVDSVKASSNLPLFNERRNQAVIYAKRDEYYIGAKKYLDVIHEFVELHGTVFHKHGQELKHAPSYLINHGLLKTDEVLNLLHQSKLFIGLGFPYEGPAPVEAIGSGCIFIQPQFNPPHSSLNTLFFKRKPTCRRVSSQHPYVEQFIGEPHVYTVDMNNLNELRSVIQKALSQTNIKPYLPYEYTKEGMLQRVNFYIENQDFCKQRQFMPPKAVELLKAQQGTSCKDFCHSKGLMCEPSFFPHLNNKDMLNTLGAECDAVTHKEGLIYPAYDSNTHECAIQQNEMLYSCVESDKSWTRLCPCRTFQPEQTALCDICE